MSVRLPYGYQKFPTARNGTTATESAIRFPTVGGAFTKFGNFFRAVSGWVWLATTVFPTLLLQLAATVDGLPWSYRLVLTMVVVALGLLIGYVGSLGFEKVANAYGQRRDGRRVATALRELHSVGHHFLPIADIASIWAGTGATPDRQNVCLRKLKHATSLGWIKSMHQEGEQITKDSRVLVTGAIAFFQARRWVALPRVKRSALDVFMLRSLEDER